MNYDEAMAKYEPIIGIETHVQLATKTKLFCSCNNDAREAEPNTLVCPVCLGLPGTLPVLNQRAVELAIRAGLVLQGEIAQRMKFDRKNYFYPDLPKGYQITQYDQPIVGKGKVELTVNGAPITVGITRAHLEEDAGKLIHPPGADYSLVDLNRTGTPLLEIVSEPDLRTPAQARAYAQEIYLLMRYAVISEANLYYGNMRFDVNVSLRLRGTEVFGTRSETKNLNSFRSVERAVEYEITRQAELLERGERVVQETRGFNEDTGHTVSQRSKEEADEYRYFPEPDLPPVVISETMIEVQSKQLKLCLLPAELRAELKAAGLPENESEVLVADPPAAYWWHDARRITPENSRFVLNWLIGERVKLEESTGRRLAGVGTKFDAAQLDGVASLVSAGKLSSTNAKVLLAHMWNGHGVEAEKQARELGLIQESNEGELAKVVAEVIAGQPQAVADYQAGNERALGALVGAAMKATQGRGNPGLLTKLIRAQLAKENE